MQNNNSQRCSLCKKTGHNKRTCGKIVVVPAKRASEVPTAVTRSSAAGSQSPTASSDNDAVYARFQKTTQGSGEKPGDKYREQAAEKAQAAQESWETSDTDGFVSQWAHNVRQRELLLKADVADAGNTWLFPALRNKESGDVVPARLLDTRYGSSWAVFGSAEEANERDSVVREWVGTGERAIAKRGYELVWQRRPARVVVSGSGQGLGGATSVQPIVIPDDDMLFSADAPIEP